jgi:hypothetical protein
MASFSSTMFFLGRRRSPFSRGENDDGPKGNHERKAAYDGEKSDEVPARFRTSPFDVSSHDGGVLQNHSSLP